MLKCSKLQAYTQTIHWQINDKAALNNIFNNTKLLYSSFNAKTSHGRVQQNLQWKMKLLQSKFLFKQETLQESNRYTSKGVRGHFPLILIAPGRITRPGFVNFPFQPLSLAASMSPFSFFPSSNIQQEKATMSCKQEIISYTCSQNIRWQISSGWQTQLQ